MINKLLLRHPQTDFFERKMHAEDFDTRAPCRFKQTETEDLATFQLFTWGKWPAKNN